MRGEIREKVASVSDPSLFVKQMERENVYAIMCMKLSENSEAYVQTFPSLQRITCCMHCTPTLYNMQ